MLLNGDKQKDDGDDYAEGFRNWFLFLLNTGLVKIPTEKSLFSEGVFESIDDGLQSDPSIDPPEGQVRLVEAVGGWRVWCRVGGRV